MSQEARLPLVLRPSQGEGCFGIRHPLGDAMRTPRRTRRWLAATAAAGLMGLTLVGVTAPTGSATATPSKPTHVLIVLFDQMKPGYADRFNMTNFQSLRASGTNFSNAYLGYMASETVISHNVIVSGQAPKNMGWVDEAFRDTNNELSAGANKMWISGSLTGSQFDTLVNNRGYAKLSDYLHQTVGGKFITVGQKDYAVESAAAGADNPSDIAVHVSSRAGDNKAAVDNGTATNTCSIELGGQYRYPAGRNVPTYLYDPVNDFCGRFYINSDKANDYGTLAQFPSRVYPEDGDRFFPGTNDAHLGGDVWVADAAMAMMENEADWSGMFVTMGGIDKAGHMWGADADTQPALGDIGYQTHVEAAAKTADAQLGRMIAKLEELGQLDNTLVVLTADHGGTYGEQFYGRETTNAGDTNWYYGATQNGTYNAPSPALQPLIDTGNVQFSYQSTAIETWLTDTSKSQKVAAAGVMKTLPGVMASYYRSGNTYKLYGTNAMSSSERSWWNRTSQGILNNLAGSSGPDVVGLLNDRVSYGAYGDHGGAGEQVQRVPVVFWAPGSVDASVDKAQFRTYDILPTILQAMGIAAGSMDGRAYSLN
jgi:hypothetical protein